jgi:hypothetical protein
MGRKSPLSVRSGWIKGYQGASKMFQRAPKCFYVPFGLRVRARRYGSSGKSEHESKHDES